MCSCRKTLLEYSSGITNIIKSILQSAARKFDLPENSFLDECGERAVMFCRFNYFPPCPKPDEILGLKTHTDGSALAILLPDKEVEGLQFLKDDKWYKVPHLLPNALLFNAGDQLEVMQLYALIPFSALILFIRVHTCSNITYNADNK